MAATSSSIHKSPLDERSYHVLELENKLRVLVISDPSAEKSAAAMAVRVGFLNDPDELPGLAHFCEHMSFMGTVKYPAENAFMEFLISNGGSTNAFTSAEYTNYMFDVAQEYLSEALDRFAQFFISPLFNADAKNREVNAVDSENENNLQEDLWRLNQLDHYTSRPGHPYNKFGTGNKLSLETRPAAAGIDVCEALLKFHSQYYSANVMSLCVLGKESLAKLADLVTKVFSNVPNKNLPIPVFPNDPYSEEELQVWIEYVPVKDVKSLCVNFCITDLSEYYDEKSEHYLAHLVGHEGAGSLLSLLKKKGWCNALAAGPNPCATGFSFFFVQVDLTDEGEGHTEDVVNFIFQYINLLRAAGPQERFHIECMELQEIDFRFKDKEEPYSYVTHVAQCIQEYKMEDILYGDYKMTTFNAERITALLNKLTPHNCRVVVQSKKFEGKTTLTEPWYGSAYNLRKIDPNLLVEWSNASPNEELHLPLVNDFIPTDFSLVCSERKEDPEVPTLIQETELSKVWYKMDDTFLLPKACLYFDILSPVVYRDPLSANMTALFTSLLVDSLTEYSYNASLAGVGYEVNNTAHSIRIEVEGYNHKQSILLHKIVHKMVTLTIDMQRFLAFKDLLNRRLKNFQANQASQQALEHLTTLVHHPAWSNEDLSRNAEDITLEGLQSFISELLSSAFMRVLIHGNISKEAAIDAVGVVECVLKDHAYSQPLPPSQRPLSRVVKIPKKSAFLYSRTNEIQSSSAVVMYLQVGKQLKESKVLLELLPQVIQEPCFTTLRTKEQLGYLVESKAMVSCCVEGLMFIVQSDKKPSHVNERIEAFISTAKGLIESMTSETFNAHKQSLSVNKLEKPKTLTAESGRYWREILSRQYQFNRAKEEVEYLQTVSRDDLLQFFETFISQDAPKRRSLVVYVESLATSLKDSDEEDREITGLIKDIAHFKASKSLYPAVVSH